MFCSKITQKSKRCSRLLHVEQQKVAQKLPNTIEAGLVAWANCFQVGVHEKQANDLFKFFSALWLHGNRSPTYKTTTA